METKQSWDPERYARNARFVSDLGMPVVELLNPVAGERILDLGCGDGALTEKLVAMGCEVVGVDSSGEQIAAAKARGLDARVADGHAMTFESEFDAVFSNAALHWMTEPDTVIEGVYRALKPGGRFVGEMGGHACIGAIREAVEGALSRRGIDPEPLNPWYFPTAIDYRTRLENAGFGVRYITHFPRPTVLPGDISGWLETFAEAFLSAVPNGERMAFLSEVRDTLRPRLQNPDGTWTADYTRLRFSATRAN